MSKEACWAESARSAGIDPDIIEWQTIVEDRQTLRVGFPPTLENVVTVIDEVAGIMEKNPDEIDKKIEFIKARETITLENVRSGNLPKDPRRVVGIKGTVGLIGRRLR